MKLDHCLFFCSYLVSTGGDVRGQSLHLTVEDVVFLHLVLHRRQVLSKAFIVQVGLVRETKTTHLGPLHHVDMFGPNSVWL